MMMTESLVCLLTLLFRPSRGSTASFIISAATKKLDNNRNHHSRLLRSSATSSSSSTTRRWLSSQSSFNAVEAIQNGISRLRTLQTLLTKYGAPGSTGGTMPNDLVPVVTLPQSDDYVPELVSTLDVAVDRAARSTTIFAAVELCNLHPHLFPIAKSTQTGNYICGLRRCMTGQVDGTTTVNTNSKSAQQSQQPWPIVEASVGGPGMRLLALQSEHFMRRIACESDFLQTANRDLILELYNEGLGKGILNDAALDKPYQVGDVAKLGYGVDKYILLRVGPFPDLYERIALQHASRGDEASALIAAESANGKFVGFGSSFRFYAQLLSSLPNRNEEARDAARMCLRLPLPSVGMSTDDFQQVAVLAQLASDQDTPNDAILKLRDAYEKIREHELQEDSRTTGGKTPEQRTIDEINNLLDTVALTTPDFCKWSDIRPKLAEMYQAVGRNDMADFVSARY